MHTKIQINKIAKKTPSNSNWNNYKFSGVNFSKWINFIE